MNEVKAFQIIKDYPGVEHPLYVDISKFELFFADKGYSSFSKSLSSSSIKWSSTLVKSVIMQVFFHKLILWTKCGMTHSDL